MEHLLARFVPRPLRNLLPLRPWPSVSPKEAWLSGLLQVPMGSLSEIRLGRRYHYRPFSIAKRDGRERRILAPSPALKQLQHRLLHNYLDTLPVHPAATAFRRGCSIVDNARRHAGQTLIATLDLADFFETTSADRVRGFFLKQGWRGEALSVLMRLCVYRNGLPQGAPTSPALSNLVNFEMDEQITDLARRADALYTRYGDDLTFSWRTDHIPASFVPGLISILIDAGYAIQPLKPWRVQRLSAEPQITGLVLGRNGKIGAPLSIRWEVFKLRWRLLWRPGDTYTAARLQGYRGFLKALDAQGQDSLYKNIFAGSKRTGAVYISEEDDDFEDEDFEDIDEDVDIDEDYSDDEDYDEDDLEDTPF